MIYIWLSALLFGMVHPGSKVILNSGLSLEIFCFTYIGIRLLAQIPFVLKQKAYLISGSGKIKIILALGVVGCLLQLSEFAGIANGSNVTTVTFLVYTHPFWSILISKIIFKEKLERLGILKLAFASIGILLIIGMENFTFINLKTHWLSLLAGLLISSWIKISNVARKAGFSTLTTNFYYDLMSFFCLVGLILSTKNGNEFQFLFSYLNNSSHLLSLIFYSIIIGLLPNLLFYKGSAIVDSLSAGYILLLEPIIASTIAYFAWNESITFSFALGALFILSANLPKELFEKIKLQSNFKLFFIVCFVINQNSYANEYQKTKTITLLEIIPTDSSEYTVSSEKKQIEIAAEMGIRSYLEKEKCDIKLEKILEIGTEELLVKKINEIKKIKGDKLLVGLSRTNFARVAAKVSLGSEIKGISVGASASNLKPINSNFMTMVNPWQEQYKLILSTLDEYKCKSSNTIAIFNPSNFLSSNFLNEYKKSLFSPYKTTIDKNIFTNKNSCIFIGLNFAEATIVLNDLNQINWEGHIIGLGDWNIYSEELTKVSKQLPRTVTLSVPTGWLPNSNPNSTQFSSLFHIKAGVEPSPIAAYVYDGVILAAEALCKGKDVFNAEVNIKKMLRNYVGMTDSGNLLSPMYIRKLRGSK